MVKFSKSRFINICCLFIMLLYLIIVTIYSFHYKKDIKLWLLMISIPLNVIQFLYTKSDKAYMLISKYIFRPFLIASCDWQFIGCIEKVTSFNIPDNNAIERVVKNSPKLAGKIFIKPLSINKYCISYDKDKIRLTVEYDPVKKKISIFTNKFTVGDTDYFDMLELLYNLLKIVKTAAKGEKEVYDIVIFYKENPYYGFYLKQIPIKFIKDFFINLTFPSHSSIVRVHKNKIQISANDFHFLKETTLRVLELSELPSR